MDWRGESVIALWVLGDWDFWGKRPFVNNGRFAYVKLTWAGESVITLWNLGSWFLWGNGRL